MIIVRAARAADVNELSKLGLDAWTKGIAPFVSRKVADRVRGNNPFPSFVKQLGADLLVATCEGSLAGMAGSETSDNHISDVWVAPKYESRGVATALIQELEKQISAKGYTQTTIEVAASNHRAHRLYVRLGYLEVWRGQRKDAILETSLQKISFRKSVSK